MNMMHDKNIYDENTINNLSKDIIIYYIFLNVKIVLILKNFLK